MMFFLLNTTASDFDISIAMYAGTLLISLLSLSIVVFMIVHQRRIMRHKRERQTAILSAIVQVQEEERKRIAAELHDDLGSKIAAVRLQLLRGRDDDEKAKDLIRQNLSTIEEIQNGLRRVSHDLLPPGLDKFGLAMALEDILNGFNTEQLSTTLHVDEGIDDLLGKEQQMAVYRVVQQLLTNTAKHANASAIFVTVRVQNSKVVLTYTDNGMGFDFEKAVLASKGLGLRNLLGRIELLSGKYTAEAGDPGFKLIVEFQANQLKS